MSKKAVFWLYREIPKLIKEGIISKTSGDKLKEYYGPIDQKSNTLLFLIITGIFGAILIGLGIISLLAHNWENLSRPIRTLISLLPLMIAQLAAGWIIFKGIKSTGLREGVATFLSLMICSSIALISQTYNISGDTASFILTWMLLTIPLVYLMRVTVPAIIYVIGITCWSWHVYNDVLQTSLVWPLIALVVPHFIHIKRKKDYDNRITMLSLVLSVCIPIAMGSSLTKLPGMFWVLTYTSVYSIFFLAGILSFHTRKELWKVPFIFVGGISSYVTAFILSYKWYGKFKGWENFGSLVLKPGFIVTAIIFSISIWLIIKAIKERRILASLFGGIPILALCGYYNFTLGDVFLPPFLFSTYLLAAGILTTYHGTKNNELGLVNLGIFMTGAWVMARFFDSDMGFITRGVAFILIGVVFILTNIYYIRKKGGA